MTLEWPSKLPCFRRTKDGYKPHNNIQRTAFNSGFVRQRRKPVGPVQFNVTLKLTGEQLQMFEDWVHYDVQDVNWFKTKMRTGAGINDWMVRLVDRSNEPEALEKGEWLLKFTVEARRPQFGSQFALYEKLYDLPDDFGTQTQNALNNLYQD